MIFITKFDCREKQQSEVENLTLQEGIRLRSRNLIFAQMKKETKSSEDKELTSLDILKTKRWSENRLSPSDEDTKKIKDQKPKNEGLEEEKDHFALVIEKGCKYIS